MPKKDTYVVTVKLRGAGAQQLTMQVRASDPYEAEREARKRRSDIEIVQDIRKL